MLRNVANVLDALGDGTVVELVTHGPGPRAVLPGAPHETALRPLIERGVQGRRVFERGCAASTSAPAPDGFRQRPKGIDRS